MVFHFYFPAKGEFKHFPTNVSTNGVVTARGGANNMKVVDSKKIDKISSFVDVIHAGTQQQVLDFLRTENLHAGAKGFCWDDMLFMLRDRPFFDKVIAVLAERLIYEPQVWQYAFYHKHDVQLMREYIDMAQPDRLFESLGAKFSCSLVEHDCQDDHDGVWDSHSTHLEYHPLVNGRAHSVGNGKTILNATFRATYDHFLSTMVQKPAPTGEERLALVYYLQLQDRMQEAIELFNSLEEPSKPMGTLRVQYDYLKAYFDFFSGQEDNFKVARRIV